MIFKHLLNIQLHPTWVRGLKLPAPQYGDTAYMSHPTWVRGLKRYNDSVKHKELNESHPTWVRGLKLRLVTVRS